MGVGNILLIVFVIVLAALSLWWAFNTIRQIYIQREFNAVPLTSIAKLWRKAKYVPEDAKDRESLYLYRDFLQKFNGEDFHYPIMVKNGGVRVMTRREYDHFCQQKDKWPVNWLLVIATVIYAVVAIGLNFRDPWFGICLAAVLPVLEVVLGVFVVRFNREKNRYRSQLFMELKENSLDFLTITKPFIIVDAYPAQFGRTGQPKYMVLGEIKDEQIQATRDYIIAQKAAETKVVYQPVDNQTEIEELKHPAPVPTAAEAEQATAEAAETKEATATNAETATAPETPAEPATPAEPELTKEDVRQILYKLIDSNAAAAQARAEKQAAVDAAPVEEIEELPPLQIGVVPPDPNADDFSLDSIGNALDAEIAKRQQQRRAGRR